MWNGRNHQKRWTISQLYSVDIGIRLSSYRKTVGGIKIPLMWKVGCPHQLKFNYGSVDGALHTDQKTLARGWYRTTGTSCTSTPATGQAYALVTSLAVFTAYLVQHPRLYDSRKQSWPNLRYYPKVRLEWLKKTMNTSEFSVFRPRFESSTSWIQVRCVNAWANLLGGWNIEPRTRNSYGFPQSFQSNAVMV
jgi:hypothetical protein